MAGQLGTALMLAGLRVVTSTPDALCPPLKAAEEAIASRLGEIRDADLVAHYRVVRGGTAGDHLVLELTDSAGTQLLHRELPLEHLSCADAPTALALQLESYLADVSLSPQPNDRPTPSGEAKAPHEPPSPPTAETVATSTPSPTKSRVEHAQLPPSDSQASRPIRGGAWGLGVSVGLNALQSPVVGLDVPIRLPANFELLLWSTASLTKTAKTERLARTQSYNAWLGLTPRYRWVSRRWSAGLGPTLAALLQSAEITGPGTEGTPVAAGESGLRAVFGFGAEVSGRYQLGRRLSLDWGARGGPLLDSATKRFVLSSATGAPVEVLAPPNYFLDGWFGLTFWPH